MVILLANNDPMESIMPIRGTRDPFPSKGNKPTGIFSTRGKQKQDGASGPHMDTLKYAHSNTNDDNGRSAKNVSAGQSVRHQKPKKSW